MTRTEAVALAVTALQDHAARCEAELALRGRTQRVRDALTEKARLSLEAARVLTEGEG